MCSPSGLIDLWTGRKGGELRAVRVGNDIGLGTVHAFHREHAREAMIQVLGVASKVLSARQRQQ